MYIKTKRMYCCRETQIFFYVYIYIIYFVCLNFYRKDTFNRVGGCADTVLKLNV